MLNIKSVNKSGPDTKSVVQEIVNSINQDEIKLVLYFVSTKYDFNEASILIKEGFPDTDVIGCTTAGEIGPDGFVEGNISAISIAADDFEVVSYVMQDIKFRSILSKNDLIKTAEKIGLKPSDSEKGFILTLIDGMQASEEKVMTTIGSCFNNLPVVGGSAGDDGKFKETFVSANGVVYNNAAVVTFVRTSKKFFMYKENIYVPTNTEFKVTKADIGNRVILEFNDKPAAEVYAEALGVSIEDLPNYFMSNPIGRTYQNNIWITSPRVVLEGKQMAFYTLIVPNSIVKLLKPVDYIAEAKKTVELVKENIPNCKGVILFNCILRYMQFKAENTCSILSDEYLKCGSICGFSTYGEQYNKQHVNQTLTLIAFGE